jgi:hypothetical protein
MSEILLFGNLLMIAYHSRINVSDDTAFNGQLIVLEVLPKAIYAE